MRRADRLFMIVEQLRPARLVTAEALAQRLEVSKRTIYRDVADLIGAGVPIEGAAGVGYLMRAGYDLPPMMFTAEEAAALMAGARMLRAFGGADLGRAAAEAMDKIAAVLPEGMAARTAALPLHVIGGQDAATRAALDAIDRAITARLSLHITYRDMGGADSQREVLPDALFFWGNVWTLGAFCTLRGDARMFRVDRISQMQTGAAFSAARAREISALIDTRRREEAGRA